MGWKHVKTPRQKAIIALGGECVKCGSVEDLEFDHLNSATKKHEISALLKRDWGNSALQLELEKCQLLCPKCHQEKSTAEAVRRWSVDFHEMKLSRKSSCSLVRPDRKFFELRRIFRS